jgi:hypothetical protein
MNSLKFAGPNFSGSSLTGENNVEFSLGAMAREHLAELATARQQLLRVEDDIAYHEQWPLSGGGQDYVFGLREDREALLATGARNPVVLLGAHTSAATF